MVLLIFSSTKQQDDENLEDYVRRCETAKEVIYSHYGGVFNFPKFYQDTEYFTYYSTGISDADLKELKDEASEQVVVWTLL